MYPLRASRQPFIFDSFIGYDEILISFGELVLNKRSKCQLPPVMSVTET